MQPVITRSPQFPPLGLVRRLPLPLSFSPRHHAEADIPQPLTGAAGRDFSPLPTFVRLCHPEAAIELDWGRQFNRLSRHYAAATNSRFA